MYISLNKNAKVCVYIVLRFFLISARFVSMLPIFVSNILSNSVAYIFPLLLLLYSELYLDISF